MITLGNWTWGQQGFAPYLSGTDRVLRPANMSPASPGRGLAIHDGVAVINLLGQLTLTPFESAFIAVDRLVEEARRETPVIIVDFHAETTSEKVAMAYHLDGRVTAVLGTHTHVQTNDARVLAGGTAAITDAGMTGPHDSVIGSVAEGAIRRFVTGMPVRLETATGGIRIEGALVEYGADGRATSCEAAVRVPVRAGLGGERLSSRGNAGSSGQSGALDELPPPARSCVPAGRGRRRGTGKTTAGRDRTSGSGRSRSRSAAQVP